MNGIDVSNHNGLIDWEKVKSSGKVDFAILRMGYGVKSAKQKDTQFERNYAECKRLGIPVGAYHYSYATNPTQALQEAKFALELLKGKEFEYPIYIDIEDPTQTPLPKTVCSSIVNAFCGALEAENYWAGVYSFDTFFQSNLDAGIPSRYATWIARVENVFPKCVDKSLVGIHQYSWKGSIPGIKGDVDLNTCYKNYPAAIKAAKKNGFKDKVYTLTATQDFTDKGKCREAAVYLQKLGMSTSFVEG